MFPRCGSERVRCFRCGVAIRRDRRCWGASQGASLERSFDIRSRIIAATSSCSSSGSSRYGAGKALRSPTGADWLRRIAAVNSWLSRMMVGTIFDG